MEREERLGFQINNPNNGIQPEWELLRNIEELQVSHPPSQKYIFNWGIYFQVKELPKNDILCLYRIIKHGSGLIVPLQCRALN